MKINDLVYGSDPTQGIVALEYKDDKAEIYFENGEKVVKEIPYFLVSETELGQKLEGNLPLKFIQTFKNKEELDRERRRLRYSDLEYLKIWDDREAALLSSGMTYFKGLTPAQVSTLSFDIEARGLTHDSNSKVLLISNTYVKNGVETRKLFSYDDYENEGEFLTAWCNWVREVNPSVLVGHYILTYDLPYLDYCARRAGVELTLGRDGSPLRFNDYESKFRRDGSQFYTYRMAHVYGRSIVDTFFLSIKYDVQRKYESYALKSIVKQEGLEVQGRQFYDASLIRENYKIPEEWAKIKKYAEHDADDSLSLYWLMIPAFFYLTQSVPKPFQTIMAGASGSQINSILLRAHIQAGHSIPLPSEAAPFEGAISIGNAGVYENLIRFDVASLYPSIMMEYNTFDRERDPLGIMPTILEHFLCERLENKKKAKETGERKFKDLEGAQKIIINSFYGFMGAPGLNFNMPTQAATVTQRGREILQKAINWVKANEKILVNADTDSITFGYPDGRPISSEEREKLRLELNSLFPSRIVWEDEGQIDRMLVLRPKNYAILQRIEKDDNGSNSDPNKYSNRVTIKGSALKATPKEKGLKQFIDETIDALIHKRPEEIPQIYSRYVKEILNIKDISRWSSRKTITENILSPGRTNEQKVLDALHGSEYSVGDKRYFYFRNDNTLALAENWNHDHAVDKLLEKLWKTLQIFLPVYDTSKCLNFKLKRNKSLLEILKSSPSI